MRDNGLSSVSHNPEPELNDPEREDPEHEDPEHEGEREGPERENSERGDSEKDDGVACGTSISVLLEEQHDWPQWLVDGIVQLQEISARVPWVNLLASFVKFERSLGFPGVVSKHDLGSH
jgi:hypothetical protein